jgi:hypothetical protein
LSCIVNMPKHLLLLRNTGNEFSATHAIHLLLMPIGVGVGIGIGIDSDGVLWLVLTHRNDRPSRHTRSMYGGHPVSRAKSHLLSFDSDSDSDTDPDPDYNPRVYVQLPCPSCAPIDAFARLT